MRWMLTQRAWFRKHWTGHAKVTKSTSDCFKINMHGKYLSERSHGIGDSSSAKYNQRSQSDCSITSWQTSGGTLIKPPSPPNVCQ